MDQHMRTSAADVASADLVYLTHHSFSLWCQRQQSVAVDHLRSPKLAKRLNARACLEGAEPASLPPAVHSLPPLNGSAQPLTPERLVPCSPTSKEALWQRVWAHPTIAAAVAASVPVVLTLTNNECGAPWGRREPPRGLLLQMTQDRTRRPYDAVVPLALASPSWLVGAEAAPPWPLAPWATRQLLFFAGHVPKLYISATRYKLWRQLYNRTGVTAVSLGLELVP